MPENSPSSLAGKRIVITRAAAQCEELANAIRQSGAAPVTWPLVEFFPPEDFGPLDAAISHLGEFDWLIFTSGEAARAVGRRCEKLGHSLAQASGNLNIAAVGPVTAEAVRKIGLYANYVAQNHSGVGLANELGERVRGRKVLLPRSDRANPDLPAELKRFGAQLSEVIAYRTRKPKEIDREKLQAFTNGEADAILFFSPSAVQHFAELAGIDRLRRLKNQLAVTAVGPVTARTLREAGVERIVVASDTRAASVIDALEKHFAAAKAAPAEAKRA